MTAFAALSLDVLALVALVALVVRFVWWPNGLRSAHLRDVLRVGMPYLAIELTTTLIAQSVHDQGGGRSAPAALTFALACLVGLMLTRQRDFRTPE